MLLNYQRLIQEIKREIKKYLENSEKRNMTYQNLWDTAKEVLRGKFITIQPYLIGFSSVTQLCPTLFDSMNHSTPGLPVHHQLPEFAQAYVH